MPKVTIEGEICCTFVVTCSRYEKKLAKAKRKGRSELSVSRGDWTKRGYAWDPAITSRDRVVDQIERVDARTLSPEAFAERFERPGIPVILTHAMEGWPALGGGADDWSMENLLRRFGEHKFKVGTDDDDYPVKVG